ncbi:hypothetical protein [Streptomyces sp. sk226]|uniref:hypothetical protein n=1 Tax=Streptomyces sp. sk226 TaxID=2034268 RepID=UPI000BF0A3B2|nr:hypothetical protein [Streptomyces sp. sk226]
MALEDDYDFTNEVQVRLTFHPAYLDGRMELEVRRVSYGDDVPGEYEELPDGEILRKELTTPAEISPAAIRAGKAEAWEELRELGLQPWDDEWKQEGEYAIYNDVKPLDAT